MTSDPGREGEGRTTDLQPPEDLVDEELDVVVSQLLTFNNVVEISPHQVGDKVPRDMKGVTKTCYCHYYYHRHYYYFRHYGRDARDGVLSIISLITPKICILFIFLSTIRSL